LNVGWGANSDISPRFAACFFLSKKAELHAGVLLKKNIAIPAEAHCCPEKFAQQIPDA
jgi:hypothetical protein